MGTLGQWMDTPSENLDKIMNIDFSNLSEFMGLTLQAATPSFYPRTIANAMVYNDDDSDYLAWTPSSAQDSNKKMSVSLWFKPGDLTGSNYLITSYTNASNWCQIGVSGTGTIGVWNYIGGVPYYLVTTALHRDPTSWKHVFFTFDSTPSTPDSSSIQLWINGVQVTDFGTEVYPPQNATHNFMINGEPIQVGTNGIGGTTYDGYFSEIICIDGISYDVTDFGQFKNGIWVPKDNLSLTYGTNGFYLDFANSGNLGNDISGNDNDFAANGSPAQVTDTPTNNFATLNILSALASTQIYSEGNLKAYSNLTTYIPSISTLSFDAEDSDGFYCEVKFTSVGNSPFIGIDPVTAPQISHYTYPGDARGGRGHNWGGQKVINTAGSAYGTSWTNGDIMGILVKNGKLYFSKNGVWQNSGDPSAETGWAFDGLTGEWVFSFSNYDANTFFQVNFGNPPFSITSGNTDKNGYGNFEYDATSFKSLCSYNIPNTIDDSSEGAYVASRDGVGKTITRTGVTHSTTQAKFDNSSMYFNGSSYLSIPDATDLDFGTGDFTVEFWMHTNTNGNIIGKNTGPASYAGWYFWSDGSGYMHWYGNNNTNIITGSIDTSTNSWVHVAACRSGTTLRLFIDGVLDGKVSYTVNDDTAAALIIGSYYSGGAKYTGYLDDIRISKGICRYDSDTTFTPPDRFNSRDSYVSFLLQSLDMPNASTDFSDTDFMKDMNFDSSEGVLAITKKTSAVGAWSTTAEEKKVLFFDNTQAEASDNRRHMKFNSDSISLGNQLNTNASFLDIGLRDSVSHGLDIIEYTGNATIRNISHGLGKVPTMWWIKNKTDVVGTIVYHKYMHATAPEDYYMWLNTTDVRFLNTAPWDSTPPTDTYFRIGSGNAFNGSGDNIIAYVFTDIPGYCKAFMYTGNGNADGPYIPLGFKPNIWFVKQVATTVRNWELQYSDLGYNQEINALEINLSNSQTIGAGVAVDILSQGLKIRNTSGAWNTNGQIYMGFAWAEQPGKYANAR